MKDSFSHSRLTSDSASAAESESVRRRDFLDGAVRTVATASIASLFGCTLPVRTHRVDSLERVEVSLDQFPELENPGGRLKLLVGRVAYFVCSSEDSEYVALSAVCTHQGCDVASKGSTFRCPCHGSRFDERGQVLGGPAREPLASFPIERVDRKLILHVDSGARR
ncbi:MAG: ubiquinol-cytochrome c reductase iron-sulfur subunit [Planctomycetota bacterium]